MYGTSSLISAGVTSETGSMPQDFAEAIRRRSSSMRSSVRATSIPPHSVKTSISRYWRVLSSGELGHLLLVVGKEHEVRRVPGRAAGVRERALVEQDDVRPAEPGEVVREAVADDPAADDDGARCGGSGAAHGLRSVDISVGGESTSRVRAPRASPARRRRCAERMTSSARSASPSRTASRSSWCSRTASSRRSTRSSARNQMRSVST